VRSVVHESHPRGPSLMQRSGLCQAALPFRVCLTFANCNAHSLPGIKLCYTILGSCFVRRLTDAVPDDRR